MNIRKEIRKTIRELYEFDKKKEKIWGCIEYFASGNYNELADYQFSSEQLMKQAKDYIKGSDKYQEFLKCCEKTLKEQKSESDTVGWYMDGEGGWADIPLLKGHLDSSFVGIHNDGTYYFDTEDPSERSGDMLSFRGFSEVLHRLGLKVDVHKVSEQLYKLAPQRLKIDLIEADINLWEQKKSKDLIHSYQDWKDSVRGIYGVGIRLVLTTDSSKTLVFQANKKVLGKQLSAYYDHIEQIGYVIKEQVSPRYKHPNKFSKGATFPYADVKMMKLPINRDKLVIRYDGRSYEIMNRDTGEFFAEELSYIELEDTLSQLDIDSETARSLTSQSESGQVKIP
jgi:hypothetical protein